MEFFRAMLITKLTGLPSARRQSAVRTWWLLPPISAHAAKVQTGLDKHAIRGLKRRFKQRLTPWARPAYKGPAARVAAMESPKDTKTRLLEAAEQLFAQQGAEKTTLRQICAVADANLAAVNYHFGSKSELISATLSRMISLVVEAQMTHLDALEQRVGATLPELEDVIRCYLAPIFDTSRNHPNLIVLFDNLSKAYGDIDRFHSRVMDLLEVVHRRYVALLHRILPHLDRAQLLYRYAFFWAGVHDIVDHWLRKDLQSLFAVELDLSEAMQEEMVRFMAAGFRG